MCTLRPQCPCRLSFVGWQSPGGWHQRSSTERTNMYDIGYRRRLGQMLCDLCCLLTVNCRWRKHSCCDVICALHFVVCIFLSQFSFVVFYHYTFTIVLLACLLPSVANKVLYITVQRPKNFSLPVKQKRRLLLLRPGRGVVYCNQFVRLSVCLSVREHISGTAGPIFTNILCGSLWPWLSPPGAALRYIMYFPFYGWRHVWP